MRKVLDNLVIYVFFWVRLIKLNFWWALFFWGIYFILRLVILIFIHASHFMDGTIRFCTGWLIVFMDVFWTARVDDWSRNNIIDTIIFCVIATLYWVVIILNIISNYHFTTDRAHKGRRICYWVYFQWLDSECACVFVLRGFILTCTLFHILIVI